MIRPRNDMVLLEVLPENNVSAGGIVVVDAAPSGPVYAKVLALGSGKYNDNGKFETMSDLKVGDTVMVERYKKWKFTLDGKELMLTSEFDIVAVVE